MHKEPKVNIDWSLLPDMLKAAEETDRQIVEKMSKVSTEPKPLTKED